MVNTSIPPVDLTDFNRHDTRKVNYKNAQQKKLNDVSVRTSEILRPAKRKSGRQKTSVKSQKLGGSIKSSYCDTDSDGFPDILLRKWRSPAVNKYFLCGTSPAAPVAPVAPVAGPTNLTATTPWEPATVEADILGSYTTEGLDGDIDYNGTLAGSRFSDSFGNEITNAPSTPDIWNIDYGTGFSWTLEGDPVLSLGDDGYHSLHFDPTNVYGVNSLNASVLGSGSSMPRNRALPLEGTLLMVMSSDNVQPGSFVSLCNRTDKTVPQLEVGFSDGGITGSLYQSDLSGGRGFSLQNTAPIGQALPLTLITFSYSYTTGSVTFSVNGGEVSSTITDLGSAGADFSPINLITANVHDDWLGGNYPGGQFFDGALRNIPSVFTDMKMYEYAFLTVDDVEPIQQYECYLANKWGLTLPAAHPCPDAVPTGQSWSSLNTNWSVLNGRTWST